jgi:nucleoid DNA-binding protein
MIKSLNRPDIVRLVARNLGLSIKETTKIAEEAEKAILELLKEREQVRIHEFGTFYQTTMKSHVIKQIRTKIPRIVLEQKSVKFRPSPILKDQIYQRTRRKPTSQRIETDIKPTKPKAAQGNIKITYQPTEVKPKANISFKPFAMMPRVDSGDIQNKIRERWEKLARSQQVEKPQAVVARETEIFLKLLLQIKKTGIKSIDFSIDEAKDIKIFAGRPRTQVSHLPKEIIKGFLTYLDLEELHLPQYRHKLAFSDNESKDKINLEVHSFPTKSGASIHIDIK